MRGVPGVRGAAAAPAPRLRGRTTCRPPRPAPPRCRPGAAGGASADRPSMEGTRRALLRLAAACCLLCALPGEGLKTGETSVTPTGFLSTALTSHQPREASDFSPVTTAIPETSLEKNLTAATLNATGTNSTEMEDASIPTTPMVGTKAETLQASTTVSPREVTVTQREHYNMSLSVNSSTEIPSPTPTASTLEENQANHEVTEPFSTTEEMDDASSATPTPPLNSVPATTNSSQVGPLDGQTVKPTAARSETRPGTSPAGATEESTMEPRTSSAPISALGSTSSAGASSTVTVRPLVTSSTSTSTSTLEEPLEPIHKKASVLDVGDDKNPELPSSPLADTTRADPLVITVISVFIVMVGILGLVGFLRYRQHNSRMEFRRLQDLPMVPLLPSRV
ncbi:mucin-2-like isoform X2 [Phalacrocorax carbo]|uniref:mucin-2-like isoform X2 n=1 Tax=Phalacrocorax carbo TaxID=9209 RepID=UPI00311935F9